VVGLFAYVVHGVVDFDWDFIAVTRPRLRSRGAARGGRPAHMRLGARRGVFAVAAGAFAAAALYSLASPWLAARRVDDAYAALSQGDPGAAVSDARSAHDINPVSVDALLAWGLAEAGRGTSPPPAGSTQGDLEPTGQLAAVVLPGQASREARRAERGAVRRPAGGGARSARPGGAYAASLATAP